MSTIASSVDLIVPRADLGADGGATEQLRQASNVAIIEGARVQEILGDEAGVTGVRIVVDGQEVVRAVRGVFLEVGLLPASALAIDLGVSVNQDQFIQVGKSQETNVPGIFAAGDITGHRARQAVISAGEGATAAVSAVDYIKSNGLGGERKDLKLIQWGSSPKPASAQEEPAAGAGAAAPPALSNALLDYVRGEMAYRENFEAYQPDLETLAQVREALPAASVTVIAATWCPDCRRNVPKLARIAEHLPGWTFRVHPRESEEARRLDVKAIPTVAVFRPEGEQELGRIVEEPRSGSLERDLLEIARSSAGKFIDI